MFELEQHGPRETIEERTIWLTFSSDLVSINNYYLVAEDIETARVSLNYCTSRSSSFIVGVSVRLFGICALMMPWANASFTGDFYS